MTSRTVAQCLLVAGALALTPRAHAGDGVQAQSTCVSGAGRVTITYSGIWPNSCVPQNPTIVRQGNVLELHAVSVGDFCLQVLRPFTVTASIDGLCDGAYETAAVMERPAGVTAQRIEGPRITLDCSVGDFNNDCQVSVQDIFDFLSAYFAAAPAADVNHGGSVTVQDIFDYLAAYFSGT